MEHFESESHVCGRKAYQKTISSVQKIPFHFSLQPKVTFYYNTENKPSNGIKIQAGKASFFVPLLVFEVGGPR
jgi:hypothetical protein